MTLEERNEKLDAAKALVLKGWAQRTFYVVIKGQLCFCVLGALREAFHCTPSLLDSNLISSMEHAAGLEAQGNPWQLAKWNDTPGRTKYEVAALFDHAKEQPL